MARILLLETSTASLTVALAEDGKVTVRRDCREPRMQASLTAPLVKEVLDEGDAGPEGQALGRGNAHAEAGVGAGAFAYADGVAVRDGK